MRLQYLGCPPSGQNIRYLHHHWRQFLHVALLNQLIDYPIRALVGIVEPPGYIVRVSKQHLLCPQCPKYLNEIFHRTKLVDMRYALTGKVAKEGFNLLDVKFLTRIPCLTQQRGLTKRLLLTLFTARRLKTARGKVHHALNRLGQDVVIAWQLLSRHIHYVIRQGAIRLRVDNANLVTRHSNQCIGTAINRTFSVYHHRLID